MHSIRLRGPWECFLPGETEPRRIEMPATWQALADLAGSDLSHPGPIRLLRRFGMPTGIDPGDRLEIVIDSAGVPLEASLNGQLLGSLSPSQQPRRLNVMGLLASRNELAISFSPTDAGASPLSFPIGEVRLEITSG